MAFRLRYLAHDLELAPGESVAAVTPTLPSPRKMWSEVHFECQRVSTFPDRPKFSYGWQYGFLDTN